MRNLNMLKQKGDRRGACRGLLGLMVPMVPMLLVLVIVVLVSVSGTGCQSYRNGPPKTDRPDPGPMVGRFSGEHGDLLFLEDGIVRITPTAQWVSLLTLALDLSPSDIVGDALEAEWRFTFLMGSEGEIRYDFADGLHLYHVKTGKSLTLLIRELVTGDTLKLTMLAKTESLDMTFERVGE